MSENESLDRSELQNILNRLQRNEIAPPARSNTNVVLIILLLVVVGAAAVFARWFFTRQPTVIEPPPAPAKPTEEPPLDVAEALQQSSNEPPRDAAPDATPRREWAQPARPSVVKPQRVKPVIKKQPIPAPVEMRKSPIAPPPAAPSPPAPTGPAMPASPAPPPAIAPTNTIIPAGAESSGFEMTAREAMMMKSPPMRSEREDTKPPPPPMAASETPSTSHPTLISRNVMPSILPADMKTDLSSQIAP